MEIYQRPNSSVWQYSFSFKGKRYRGSTGVKLDRPDLAKAVLAKKYDEVLNERVLGQKEPILIADAFKRILRGAKGPIAQATQDQYNLARRKLLGEDCFGPDNGYWSLPQDVIYMHQVSNDHVEDLIAERRVEGIKANSINGELRALRRVHNACAKRYRVNDTLTIDLVDGFEKSRYLTDEEVTAIYEALDLQRGSPAYDKARDLLTFLLHTGVRLNEALNLRWAQVNRSQGVIEVYRQKTKSKSLVPITDAVEAYFARVGNHPAPFVEMTRAVRLLRATIAEVCNHDPVVVSQDGAATIHTLRDTYASRLVQANMSLLAVSKLLGHSSVAMTRKYAHLKLETTAEEARRIINARAV